MSSSAIVSRSVSQPPAHVTSSQPHSQQSQGQEQPASSSSSSQPTTSRRSVKICPVNVCDERLHVGLISLLGCVLTQLVSFETTRHPQGRGPVTLFHTAYEPSISIAAYLRRLALYSKCSSEVLLQAVLHLHQLMQRSQSPLVLCALNVHRLLLTSLMCTVKFFDDGAQKR